LPRSRDRRARTRARVVRRLVGRRTAEAQRSLDERERAAERTAVVRHERMRRPAGGAAKVALIEVQRNGLDEALHRLGKMLGLAQGWQTLTSFLPPELRGGLRFRSVVAATFAATLEMCKSGKVMIRQDGHFKPIFVRNQPEPAGET